MTNPLHTLRALCLALPEVTERLSHGEPMWFVRGKKGFVMYADHHHDDRVAFWCAAPQGAQESLVAAYPDRYFRPPYVGVKGWLGVYVDIPVDWDEIAILVEDAYRCIAPAKLLAQLPPAPSPASPDTDQSPTRTPPRSVASGFNPGSTPPLALPPRAAGESGGGCRAQFILSQSKGA